MAKGTTAQAPAHKKAETKRVIRSEAERIADLEAKLAEARERAEKRANKARDEAWAKRAKLVEKRDKLNEQIAEIDSTYPQEESADEPLPLDEDTES